MCFKCSSDWSMFGVRFYYIQKSSVITILENVCIVWPDLITLDVWMTPWQIICACSLIKSYKAM